MYWTTVGLFPFYTMPIRFYTALTNAIFFFLAPYTTFPASSNCCKIYIVFHFIVLAKFKFVALSSFIILPLPYPTINTFYYLCQFTTKYRHT